MAKITVVTDNGLETLVDVSRSDLIAEVKAKIVLELSFFQGLMLSLTLHGMELEDERMLGSYGMLNLKDVRLVVTPSVHQPFSPIDYIRMANGLVNEGFKKEAASAALANAPDEWNGTWTGGDSYKSFPPVDVNNPFSTVPPSSSRQVTLRQKPTHEEIDNFSKQNSQNEAKDNLYCEIPDGIRIARERREKKKEHENRERFFQASQARLDRKGDTSFIYRQRSASFNFPAGEETLPRFMNIFTCIVRGCHYTVFHKSEGKWTGDAVCTGAEHHPLPNGEYVCSSSVVFHPKQSFWTEQRLITSNDGVSVKQRFSFLPRADGFLLISSDEPYLREAETKVKEVSPFVIVMFAVDSNGVPVFTETTTFGPDFQSRVRSGQRFSSSGKLMASYLCRERKFVDEDSGAIEAMDNSP